MRMCMCVCVCVTVVGKDLDLPTSDQYYDDMTIFHLKVVFSYFANHIWYVSDNIIF